MPDPCRVLVADDAVDLRELLCILLSVEEGFEVVAQAADGREAVEQATRHRPDLTLLDLAMPVMDGLQALPLLRAALPDSKIVVFSGFDGSALAAEAHRGGADAYVEKGTDVAALVSTLRGLWD